MTLPEHDKLDFSDPRSDNLPLDYLAVAIQGILIWKPQLVQNKTLIGMSWSDLLHQFCLSLTNSLHIHVQNILFCYTYIIPPWREATRDRFFLLISPQLQNTLSRGNSIILFLLSG